MHKLLRTLSASAVFATAAACVKSYVPPEERVIAAGRYEYQATLLPPGAADSVTYRGALVVTAATADSLAGRWEVPGYDPPLRENHWNVASYNVHARTGTGADTLTIIHSIERGRGDPACRVSINRTGYRAEGTCTLRLPR